MSKEISLNNKISIIIPIYNIENLLNQMLESIKAQTYENLEIILINDEDVLSFNFLQVILACIL